MATKGVIILLVEIGTVVKELGWEESALFSFEHPKHGVTEGEFWK